MTRPVLIHAGAHKTGTTSLQTLFTRHRADLRERGILYPTTGVLPQAEGIDSQTNLAWELLGHVFFDGELGTMDDLLQEIDSSECEKVLLSSEDFACLFNQPGQLKELKVRLEGVGLTPHVVLALRDISETLDSLFITLVEFGLALTHEEFSARVAENGQVTIGRNTYCFDNDVLVRSFVDVFGEQAVTCVEYDPVDAVRPFLDAVGWFFDGALDRADRSIRQNTTVNRVEALRGVIWAERGRISELEAEVGRLNGKADYLAKRLALSEARFSRRLERKLRSLLHRGRPGAPAGPNLVAKPPEPAPGDEDLGTESTS